jgi:signal transduction histidine kinase
VTYPINGIRVRLAALFTVGFAALLAIGAFALYWRLDARFRRDFDDQLRHTGTSARALFEHDRPEFRTTAETAAHLLTELVFADRTIVAVNAEHRRIAATLPYADAPLLDDLDLRVHAPAPTTVSLRAGPARLLEVPLPDGVRLLVAMPLEPLELRLRELRVTLGVGLPLILLLGAIVGLTTSRRALQPLIELSGAADRIGEAALRGEREPPTLPATGARDEIGHLRDALDRLVRRGSQAHRQEREVAERQRAFLADAAHELRTPVAIIRSEAEASLAADADAAAHRAALGAIAHEAAGLGALLGDLLALARERTADQPEVRERFYLDDLAHRVVARARKLPAAQDREIVFGEFAEAPVYGNRELIERAVLALIHNALVHAAPSRIELAAGTRATDAQPVSWIAVRDWGPGIPAAGRARIFERFARLDLRKPGSGLGLAIARQVAELHAGSLVLSPAATDARTEFILQFPAADQPSEVAST